LSIGGEPSTKKKRNQRRGAPAEWLFFEGTKVRNSAVARGVLGGARLLVEGVGARRISLARWVRILSASQASLRGALEAMKKVSPDDPIAETGFGALEALGYEAELFVSRELRAATVAGVLARADADTCLISFRRDVATDSLQLLAAEAAGWPASELQAFAACKRALAEHEAAGGGRERLEAVFAVLQRAAARSDTLSLEDLHAAAARADAQWGKEHYSDEWS
jgi:hypothetical protein